jgi:CBS domain-containing protein
MAVIYKLMCHGELIGQWHDLHAVIDEASPYLDSPEIGIEALRLTGFLTGSEQGATPAFTVSGRDIPAYFTAAEVVLRSHSEADDAAQALGDLPEEQRKALLDLLQPAQRRRVQALLRHGRPDAGELMRTDFLCFYEHQTVGEALDRVHGTSLPDDLTARIFVVNDHQRFEGSVTLRDLIRASPEAALREVDSPHPSVRPDTKLGEIAMLMAQHDTTVIPVIDKRQRPAGVITADDVLELLLPARWSPEG